MSVSNTPGFGRKRRSARSRLFRRLGIVARKSENIVEVGRAYIDIGKNRIYRIGIVMVGQNILLNRPPELSKMAGFSRFPEARTMLLCAPTPGQ